MFPQNLTRTEVYARSALLQTHDYQVVVDLGGQAVAEPERQFRSTSTVRFTAREAGSTFIDLIADEMVEASLDGQQLDPAAWVDSRLRFSVSAGEHELTVRAVCRFSRSGEGLHRFVDPADQRVYLYTQFEVSDARRVFACFEQPDLKARFTLSVIAPHSWAVIAGGPEAGQTSLADGLSRRDFAETKPISTYLTGLVAGEYAVVSQTFTTAGGEVPMSLLCRQSLAEHLDADRIFATTVGGFSVFEKHFGVPYPFGKYDQAFVPEYNGGAMENVGCVTFRDEYIFSSRVTAAQYTRRDDTILHELSHMWFGDLVTMRWWDDLWLKESFATWASNFATGELAEDPTLTWSAFAHASKSWAVQQDQLPSTHPIAADMVDLEAVELNFDGITYAKGGSVLVQLVAFVGQEAFLAGLRTYFAEHAYGNTELVDLLRHLEAASGRDLSGWSAEWLEKTGINTLRADFTVDDDGVITSFALEQTADPDHPTLRSHRLAVGLYHLDGDRLERVGRIETDISGPRTEIPELVGLRQPDLILPNDDDLTYTKVRLDPRSLQTAIDHLHHIESTLSRAVLWGAAWDMCRDGELPAADYVDLALHGVASESDLTAVRSILLQAQTAVSSYSPLSVRRELAMRWQDGLADLLAAAQPGSDHQTAFARAYPSAAINEAGAAMLESWLTSEQLPAGLVVDQELRWPVVSGLSRLGVLSPAEISAEAAADQTITGVERAAAALAASPDPAAKEQSWSLATQDPTVPNATQQAICLTFWQRDQTETLEPYVDRWFTLVEQVSAAQGHWADNGMAQRNNVVRHLFPWPDDLGGFVERLDQWLAGTELAASLMRIISERRDGVLRALHCQSAARPAAV